MSHIQFNNISKSYGAVKVIHDINFAIEQGEFIVLVGPSGCGKTTTLRMLAGLEEVTGGNITLSDRDITTLKPGDRNCSMVFQNYALYPHMSVRDNISYAMKVHKISEDVIATKVEEAAKILGLEPYLDRKPKNLSGGQRQRVAIGRALVRDPEVFLFDEPLSNLDAKLRVEMRTEIKLLQRRLGTTAVYVTHDQVEAMTMADRVVVMRAGVIEQFDAPMELYERPVNKFVANFIGSPAMNFFDATIENGNVILGDQKLKMTADDAKRLKGVSNVIFGVRPEHMRTSEDQAELEFDATVIEPLGAHKLVLGQLAAQKLTAQIDPRTAVEVGTKCKVPIDMSQVHFFDAQTENRI